jgi:NADH-quinone oxidoreductase subunit N
MSFDISQLWQSAPLLVVVGCGVMLLMLEAFAGNSDAAPQHRLSLMPLTLASLGVALVLELRAWPGAATAHSLYGGMLVVDRMTIFFDCLFLVTAGLTAMLAAPFMREHRFEFGEFYALLMFATSGMMMLSAAGDLVTVFLGIETMSIAVYVLTGSWRRSAKSSEGAMKYFLTGAFATAILLYGMALVYGAIGSTNLATIGQAGARAVAQPIFVIGMLLIVAALAFKIAAVPFHMWAPDAYEGAPTPVTAFMAAGVKAAGFATVIRLLGTAFVARDLTFGPSGWGDILYVLAVLTMTLGNLAALKQENIKRLLAYSSIAHAGYLLVGVVAMASLGAEARGPLLFYLAAYTFTTVGAFGVVAWLGSHGDERLLLDDWAGLAARHPAAALAMSIFMLSLGGVPPTAGFFGKLYLFRAALARPGLVPLVVIAVLNSVVSVYYYLRVVTSMYFREVGREAQPIRSSALTAALVIAALATLALGLAPAWLVDTAAGAVLGG